MKVFLIISGDLWAGAEVMTFNLLRELRNIQALKVFVVCLNDGRLVEELRRQRTELWVVDEHRYSFSKLVLEVRSLIRRHAPQIVHTHRYKENIIGFLAKSSSAKILATQHGLPEFGQGSSSLISELVYWANRYLLTRKFDQVVGVSSSIKDYFLSFGARPERVRVINNGVEVSVGFTRRIRPEVRIGSAGRFFPVKDYPLMVEVARILSQKGMPVRFQLAGEGPERLRLEGLIDSYRLRDRFRLCGHIDHMAGFYAGIDIYLSTSINEGIPMSILEAMAHGLTVVAPAVGGIVEIIEDGVQGFLVKGRSPEAFAEKCILLQDAELRQKMGRAARDRVERAFSVRAMAQEYYRLYRELVAQ